MDALIEANRIYLRIEPFRSIAAMPIRQRNDNYFFSKEWTRQKIEPVV